MILGHVHPRSNAVGQILTEDLKMDDPLGYEMYDIGGDQQGYIGGRPPSLGRSRSNGLSPDGLQIRPDDGRKIISRIQPLLLPR